MLKKTLTKIYDNMWFAILFIFLVFYYIYRMFGLAASYDEMYSYFHFISKGFFYSATHWPLPNNHVFFSMASSLLNLTGNGYVAMRGVSYISGLGTIILLYLFINKCFNKTIGVITCCFYGSFILVNEQAVQGRGYSFATFFMMICIYNGYIITMEKEKRKNYILWTVGLWLGLYTLVSSIYWVLALCLCFGLVLLVRGEKSKLWKLIIASVISALLTLCSYIFLWLYMGAEIIQPLLGLQESAFRTIIRHPRSSLVHGFQFMNSNDYMQGVDRAAYFRDFKYFFRLLFRDFTGIEYLYVHVVLLVISLIFFALFIYLCIKYRQSKLMIPSLLVSVGIWTVFLVLTIQSAYPFNRNFTFLGVFFAIIPGFVAYGLYSCLSKKLTERIISLVCIPVLLLFFIRMSGPSMNLDYYTPDKYSDQALRSIDLSSISSYMADSEYGFYQMEFFKVNLKLDCEYTVSDPDMLFLYTVESNYSSYPFIQDSETVNSFDYSQYNLVVDNGFYQIYIKK